MSTSPPTGFPSKRKGERRWPMALAVITVGALHAWLPSNFRFGTGFVFQFVLLVFLAILIIGDPGRIDNQARWQRVVNSILIAVITLANTGAVVKLVIDILDNDPSVNTATELLQIGVIVWLANVLTFALWFWDLDTGGPVRRAAGGQGYTRAFVFPEMNLHEHADGLWAPQFVDYLALSFNTATAFSPTDVSAVKPWSKLMLAGESFVSLVVGVLVLSRAINIWPTPA